MAERKIRPGKSKVLQQVWDSKVSVILKSLSFLINLAASDDALQAWDTEEARGREEWRYLLGGGEGKFGKFTIQFTVLKEGSVALSLTCCVLWAKPLPLSGPPSFFSSIKQGPLQLAAQPGTLKDRQGSRGCMKPVSDCLCWLQAGHAGTLWYATTAAETGVWTGLAPVTAFSCVRWERCRESSCRLGRHGLGGLTGNSKKGRASPRLTHPVLSVPRGPIEDRTSAPGTTPGKRNHPEPPATRSCMGCWLPAQLRHQRQSQAFKVTSQQMWLVLSQHRARPVSSLSTDLWGRTGGLRDLEEITLLLWTSFIKWIY